MKLIVEIFDKYRLKWKDFLNYNLNQVKDRKLF